MIAKEMAIRDGMIASLEKGRNSIRPLVQYSIEQNQKEFLKRVRDVDMELESLIATIRTSPIGFKDQVPEWIKFGSYFADGCEFIAHRVDTLYGKVLESKLNFDALLNDNLWLRKLVVDLQNTYKGQVGVMNRANLTILSVQRKLDRNDWLAARQTIEDLKSLSLQSEEFLQKMTSQIQTESTEIDKLMKGLEKAGMSEDMISKIRRMWESIKKPAKEIGETRSTVTTYLELASTVIGVSQPLAGALMGVLMGLTRII